MARNVKSFRLHPLLQDFVENKAADLQTSEAWVIEAAVIRAFADEMPKGITPGMPHKEKQDNDN